MIPVVPMPANVTQLPGSYTVPHTLKISADSAEARNVADFAVAFLRERGVSAVVVPSSAGAALRLSTGEKHTANEGYRLRIDAKGVAIDASAGPGLYYGLQTLEQLFPAAKSDNTIRDVAISDSPAYKWRGMMLDVSRHFFDVATVERFIDLEAHYKLNMLHWHLSDDQGWRIEIKRYPKLTQVGGCRAGTQVGHNPRHVDDRPYCGYYTQEQIRDVVAYAAKRYVNVVPEIDMPGHSAAAIAAYSFLDCGDKDVPVSKTWGDSRAVCPRDRSVEFEENVLDELMQLFPSRYIHAGGDEVPSVDGWSKDVQATFERRIERYVESKGRRMVGWDEILDGGISTHAVIMSWRGERGGIAAAQHGNEVVMSPDGPLYFNSYQGASEDEPDAYPEFFPLQQVYDYNPTPSVLSAAQSAHILGVQANLWAEYIPTAQQLFYQALPRELALSEIAWVPAEKKDWHSFVERSGPQYLWLQNAGYNFRIPNPTFTVEGGALHLGNVSTSVRTVTAETDESHVRITLNDAVPNGAIMYTTDGTKPGSESRRYDAPLLIVLAPGQRIEFTAIVVLPDGRKSTPTELVIRRPR